MLQSFDRLKFRTKINVGTVGIVLLLSVLLGVLGSRIATRALIDEVKKRGVLLAQHLAARAADPLLARDMLRLKNTVDDLKALGGDTEYAFLMDVDGNVPAHSFLRGFPVELAGANGLTAQGGLSVVLLDTGEERVYDFAAPVNIAGTRFGTARVGLSWSRAKLPVERLSLAFLTIGGGGILAAVLLSTLFATQVTRRVHRLREHAVELVRGNLSSRTAAGKTAHCWEMTGCGKTNCPAYGDAHRRCWYLAGTMCVECDSCPYPRKLESCVKCPVYQATAGDEIQELAETFDVMAQSLQEHIEELNETHRSLTRQQQIMRTILDVTPDLVSLLDENLVYRACNRAFARSVGLEVDEVVGRSDEDLFPPELAAERTRANRQVLETGQGSQTESRREAEGGQRWFHTVQVPVFESGGQGGQRIVGVLRTARDVTELKTVQEQLVQAQKMESLGKLAGGVAHEINTPLGVILGYAQLLQEDAPEGGQMREDLGIIERQAKVCRKIVADLLGFSRQTEGSVAEMCVNNSVLEAAALVRHSFGLERVRIATDLDEGMPVMEGDADRLKQVWINLLNNARDAMPGGGVVSVRTRQDLGSGQVVVSVADTGQGIDAEVMPRLFDPFFSTKPVGQGTGLGLAVSFGIVRDHGGSIQAQSPVPDGFRPPREPDDPAFGPGALFEVRLPLVRPAGQQKQHEAA